jgi:hypothetical protein
MAELKTLGATFVASQNDLPALLNINLDKAIMDKSQPPFGHVKPAVGETQNAQS